MKQPIQDTGAILSQSVGAPWPPEFCFGGSRGCSGLGGAHSLTSPTPAPQPVCGWPGHRLRAAVQALGFPEVASWARGCAWHLLRGDMVPKRSTTHLRAALQRLQAMGMALAFILRWTSWQGFMA